MCLYVKNVFLYVKESAAREIMGTTLAFIRHTRCLLSLDFLAISFRPPSHNLPNPSSFPSEVPRKGDDMTFFQTYRHILRRIYNTIGFTQGYNFVLWFILSGALVGFCLARIRYIDIDNVFCGKRGIALPGECYTLGHGRGKIGITLHLAGIIPAGFLVVLQFTPVIRHRWTMFHRINGYLIMLLAMISFAGVIIIGNIHFGGSLTTQVLTGAATLIFLTCLGLAFYHIKRLQIEQHRAWMLRAWVSVSLTPNLTY